MVGGKVIGVVLNGKKREYLLHVQDTTYGHTCAVRCSLDRLDDGKPAGIMTGDIVWWQCGKVFWNPPRAHKPDIPLKKIGYSH